MRHQLWISAIVLSSLVVPGNAQEEPKSLTPTPLAVNTSANEDEAHVSPDGLTLYYCSKASKREVLMVTTRKSVNDAWGSKSKAVEGYGFSEKSNDRCIFTIPTKAFPRYIFYATRDEKSRNYDIYAMSKDDAKSVWTARRPVQSINSAADELHPWLTGDGKSLYFSRKTNLGWKIFVSQRPSATGIGGWGDPTEVDLPLGFHHATLTPDGKTMYLQGKLAGSRWGLFVSHKSGKTWDKPMELKALNGDGEDGDRSPNLSRDGSILYFASDRSGGKGGFDLYSIKTAALGEMK